MTRESVLVRLCRLSAKVREHAPLVERAGQSLAADCFCWQGEALDKEHRYSTYQFDEDVMAFLETAVEAALLVGGSGHPAE